MIEDVNKMSEHFSHPSTSPESGTGESVEQALHGKVNELEAANRLLERDLHKVDARLDAYRESKVSLELKICELEATLNEKVRSSRKYRQLYDLAPVAYVTVDRHGEMKTVNLAATCILRRSSIDLIGVSFFDFVHADDVNRIRQGIESAVSVKPSRNWQVSLSHSCGTQQDVLLVASPFLVSTSTEPACQLVIVDISRRTNTEKLLRSANEYLEGLAHKDPLTNLANRMRFSDRLQTKIANKSADKGKLAVIYFDLDGFKPINDSMGHHAGDLVLCEIADRLTAHLGNSDSIARIGGDEFTVILDGPDCSTEAVAVARELVDVIRQPMDIQGTEISVTCSMGISMYPEHAVQMEKLVKGADAAMYRAKRAGKNQVCLYSAEVLESTDRSAIIETSLYKAVSDNQLTLHYQPVYNIRTRRIASLEALVRLQHPVLGTVSPAEFIPLAEKSNHILDIGRWIIDNVCEQIRSWQDQGLRLPVAMNVSTRQLSDDRFVESLQSALDRFELSPSDLEIEVTESAHLLDQHQCKESLVRLQLLGHTITIDDFGTGYSGFARLLQLPITRLKIDQSFIKSINDSDRRYSVVSSMVRMAHDLNLRVVSEGVETHEQLQCVTQMNCDYAQGHCISRALPSDDVTQLLHRQDEGSGSGFEPHVLPAVRLRSV